MATHHRYRRHRSWVRRVKRILLTPFYIVANIFIGLKDALDQTLLFLGLKPGIRRSHNKDFERAGRESAPRMLRVDTAAAAKLNKAHQERATESIAAELWEKRVLARNSNAAKELREEMTNDARSVSSGSVISHLAKMNRKSKSQPPSDETDSKTIPDGPAKESAP